MKKNHNFFAMYVIALLLLGSCQKEGLNVMPQNSSGSSGESTLPSTPQLAANLNVYYGPNVSFNNSSIRSFFKINTLTSVPQEIGYEINNAVFQNLPNANALGYQEFLIPLPSEANRYTLFDHLTFHWNPNGHDPQGVFSVPHFDFHCYTIPLAERLAIDMNDPAIMMSPDPFFLPDNYYGPTGPMSAMGSHWVDLLSPEFNGQPFTRTFIFGGFNGQVIFEEPMITLAHFNSPNATNDVIPIRQPAAYQRAGYYPTKYRIRKNNGLTSVALTDFVYRNVEL
jgi:hypothetical protein